MALILQLPATAAGQATASGLETFQRFTNGKVGVKEAVVYRRILRPNGTLLNEEWVRFGYQDQGNTWYAQRLIPSSTNTPSKLVPRGKRTVYGASFTHRWVITDTDVHVARKEFAAGSVPGNNGALERDFMLHALALGLPCNEPAQIEWQGIAFTAPVVSKWLPDGTPLATNRISGHLLLDANGRPRRAEYSGVGAIQSGTITYQYDPKVHAVPARFTLTLKSGRSYLYEFLTLSLGTAGLENTDGYVPRMFADPHLARTVTLWTNDLPYTSVNGKTIPAFETSHPKRAGALVMGAVAAGSVILLALWYRQRPAKSEYSKTMPNK